MSVTMIMGTLIGAGISNTETVKAEDYGISNPRINEDGSVTWDKVKFGNYKQSVEFDYELIKWRILSADDKPQLKTIKLSSVVCKRNTTKISSKVSVSGANVKIKVGGKAYKKATVKGKKFTLKVAKLKKKTKVVIKVTKSGYKSFSKICNVK